MPIGGTLVSRGLWLMEQTVPFFPLLCIVMPDFIAFKLRKPRDSSWFLNARERQSLSLAFQVLHNPAPIPLSKRTLLCAICSQTDLFTGPGIAV